MAARQAERAGFGRSPLVVAVPVEKEDGWRQKQNWCLTCRSGRVRSYSRPRTARLRPRGRRSTPPTCHQPGGPGTSIQSQPRALDSGGGHNAVGCRMAQRQVGPEVVHVLDQLRHPAHVVHHPGRHTVSPNRPALLQEKHACNRGGGGRHRATSYAGFRRLGRSVCLWKGTDFVVSRGTDSRG